MNHSFVHDGRYHPSRTAYLTLIACIALFTVVSPVGAELLNQGVVSPFTAIYEKVAPTVVRINVKSDPVSGGDDDVDSPWEFFFRNPQRDNQRPIEGMGSGVIIDQEGHVVTNNHVVASAEEISVKVNEDETYDAEVIGTDPDTDLALIKLKLDGRLLPAGYVAELGDSDTIRPGDYAIAIGNPIGLDRTINVGVISALGRHGFFVQGGRGPAFQDFIQTDAQINPGNSGGALVDIHGRVVGINDMYTQNFAGIGFAIPINLARDVIAQLKDSGTVKRGFVGISVDPENRGDVTDEVQEALGLPSRNGVLINEVLEESPAADAGLKHGDVVIALDGAPIEDFQDFLFRVGGKAPGETVSITVWRDKAEKTMDLTLAERPARETAEAPAGESVGRGIHVVDIDSPEARDFRLGGLEQGVVVVDIDPGSPAAEANLRAGDIILEIQQNQIRNTRDFMKVMEDQDYMNKPLLIYRQRVFTNGNVVKGYVTVDED